LKFLCFSNFVGLLMQAKKYLKLNSCQEDRGQDMRTCTLAMLKHLLLVVQAAHLSLLYPSHDALVGIFGMITSALDVKAQWPAAPTPTDEAPKAIATAKEMPEQAPMAKDAAIKAVKAA